MFSTPVIYILCVCFHQIADTKSFEGGPCDVWALGVLLYEMVCGYLPFDGKNMAELEENIRRGVSRPPCVSVGIITLLLDVGF